MTKVPRHLLERLREDIAFRRIDSGIRLLESHRHLIDSCGPGQENGVVFLAHLAQWVDTGFDQPELIKNLLLRFPQSFRTTLPVRDFAHLQMAEGFVALLDQKNHEAIRHFEMVLSIQAENHDEELITSANLWIGLCYRRQGRYHDALGYVIKARTLATKLKYPKLVAVLQVLEGWIAFQEGNSSEAGKILGKAEAGLLKTDDYIARGNINSIYGRIARRNGNYDQAIRRFEIAIKEYQKRDQQHRNIARCLVNIGLVERLLALQLQEKLDGDTIRDRTEAKGVTPDTELYQQRERQRLKGLRKMAIQRLAEARTIYRRHRDYRGMGNVQVNLGYLWLDVGKLDVAASEGAAAYSLASKRSDSVLKARARILQSAVECAKYDEQIEEETTEVSTPAQCSRSACEYANEAVRAAEDTQNRRLKTKAFIALGSALYIGGDFGGVERCCDQASELLEPSNYDYVWRELQILRAKLRKMGGIESRLRAWSQGEVGKKTFKQVSEEFASIVIPRVWQREGHKISRVATRLSVSPKKVRRILRTQQTPYYVE